MDSLISIRQTDNGSVVSARELYGFLCVKTDFSDWCKRMFEYGFLEGMDFTPILGKSTGGRPSIDYALTIDCAKEISMLQRSEKGKEARMYFIECEKKVERASSLMENLPKNEDEVILMAINTLTKRCEMLKNQLDISSETIKAQAPKVQYHDEVLCSDSGHATTIIAKELGMSAIALNQKLRDKGVLMKVAGVWVLKAQYQSMGYTKTKTHAFVDGHGRIQSSIQTVWMEKGRKFIHELLKINLYTA